MAATFTPIAVKAAALTIEERLPIILADQPRLRNFLHVATMYRRMAIGFLLISGTPDAFFDHLFKAGRCYLAFLQSASDDAKVTAKSEPFFDAVACNDLDGARLIATHSRDTWNSLEEYEDDFYYFRWLMGRFFLNVGVTEQLEQLTKYEAVLNGAQDFRFDLLKAYFDRDQSLFDDAVEAFVAGRSARYDEARAREALDPDEAATIVHVSTELLAWLRLADLVPLRTKRVYAMAPSVARHYKHAKHPAPDSWQTIPSYRELT